MESQVGNNFSMEGCNLQDDSKQLAHILSAWSELPID